MKKIILLLLTLLFTAAAFGQSEEEKAIRKVIEDEYVYRYQCDFDNWQNLWTQDANSSFSFTWPSRHWSMTSWKEMSDFFKKDFSLENCNPRTLAPPMWDFKFIIDGDMAYVSSLIGEQEQELGNKQFYVLKKNQGAWKIENRNWIGTNFFKLQERKEGLAKFEGKWDIDYSTVSVEPPNKGIEWVENNFSCHLTDVGLTIDEFRNWKDLYGEWHFTRHTQLVHLLGQKEMTVFATGINAVDYTNAQQGKATLDEDGTITISYFDLKDPSFIYEKTILKLDEPNTLKVIWLILNKEGEVTGEGKADFLKNTPAEATHF